MVGSCFVRLLLMQQWIWLGLRLQLNGCRWLKIIWSSHFGHLTRFTFYLPRAEKRRTSRKIVILHEDSFERMDIIYWIGWKTSQNSNSMKSFERVFKQKTHQSRKSEGDKSQTHKQTCNSDELFHEIGMVRLQPEVISCTEWMALVVLVWDAVLVTDVVVGVVWVNGNGDVPKSDDNRFFFEKTPRKMFGSNE